MPRRREPPRLWKRQDEGVWIILDGKKQIRTGCRLEELDQAQEALREYLNSKDDGGPLVADPTKTTLGEIIARYVDDQGAELRAPDRLRYAVQALAPYWGDLTPNDITVERVREYERKRGVAGPTVRRELGVLQAALNHAETALHLANPPRIKLPKKAPPRDRWLTMEEVDRLRRHAPDHLIRFLRIALVTGRRMRAILNLRWSSHHGGGWIDLEHGVIHFAADGEIESKKKKGSARMTPDLHAAAREWFKDGNAAIVHFRGKPISDIGKAFDAACSEAGLCDVSPHTLKHTAVTWAFQGGMTLEDASSYFCTSAQTLMDTYRKHSPHHNERAVSVMDRVEKRIFANRIADANDVVETAA